MVPPIDLLVVGNLVVDYCTPNVTTQPSWGELVRVDSTPQMVLGGNGGNVAINASRLGINVSLVSSIGQDANGDWLLRKLTKANVNIDQVTRSPDKSTGTTIVFSHPNGERALYNYSGANEDIDLRAIGHQNISMSSIILVCGYFLVSSWNPSQVAELFEEMKRGGAKTCLDISWDPSGKWDLGDDLQSIDIFLTNEMELQALTSCDEPEVATGMLLDRGLRDIVVKRGDKGATWVNKKGITTVPARTIPLNNIIDSTGAGDSFNAGLLYGILKKWDKEKCILLGNILGSMCVQQLGGDLKYLHPDHVFPKLEEGQ